jgi:hypothetical protein
MRKIAIICILLLFFVMNLFSQMTFQTVAEVSDYKSTSRYDDVISFIEALKKASPHLRVENLATSAEGRKIPLLIIANPLPNSPEDLAGDKRIVIYIQANIHAGEVEGKEATLMFARDLLKEKNPAFLKNVIILICPIFNPDGNEKISPFNRTNQNGPVNGVGVRYNGQFLDLNRDGMKAESPEVRGIISNVFNRWDPSVFMDCHTTDGSYHVEPVTFTWMVNPNGDNSLITYMRDKMMPEMSSILANKYKVENCFYGEFNDMMDPDKGWILDASEPHYIVNYFGIRNRLGVLNENYVYADFKSRVLGCYSLIHSLLDYVAANKDEIKKMLREVDNMTIARGSNPAVTDSIAIEYSVKPAPEKVTVRTYEADLVVNPNGRNSFRRSDRQKDVTIPYYIDYQPLKNVKFPFAYLIATRDPSITGFLKMHGIKIDELTEDANIEVSRFEISELRGAARLNQGHYTNTIKGGFINDTINFPAGTIVVRTAQPLANLVTYLLEPQSNDGMMTWNFFDRYLVPQWGGRYNTYPVYKILDRIDLITNPFLK